MKSTYKQTEEEKVAYENRKANNQITQAEKKASNQAIWKNHGTINTLAKLAKAKA